MLKRKSAIGMQLWAAPLALTAMLSGCGQPAQLRVHDSILTLSPVDTNPSVMYFTALGGLNDTKLLKVSSPSAIRMEIHSSGKDPETGMMTMEPLSEVPVPKKGRAEFKQGGKHVMVWGVNLRARKLGEMETEFLFADGTRILVKVPVREQDGSIPDEKKALS